ncbi:MAG: hypothetical protein ACI9DC_000001, partial [Gammaproteobacteria bacterium]
MSRCPYFQYPTTSHLKVAPEKGVAARRISKED